MTYDTVLIEKKTIAGVCERTSMLEEQEYEGAKIPGIWRAYFQSSILDPIPNEVPDTPPYAVYHGFEEGMLASYDVLVGAEVSSKKGLPSVYQSVQIEPGKYLRFDAKGDMPMTTATLWADIIRFFQKDKTYKRVFGTDFEIYPGEDEVSIFIGIQD